MVCVSPRFASVTSDLALWFAGYFMLQHEADSVQVAQAKTGAAMCLVVAAMDRVLAKPAFIETQVCGCGCGQTALYALSRWPEHTCCGDHCNSWQVTLAGWPSKQCCMPLCGGLHVLEHVFSAA